MNYILVGIGGALGSILRYGLNQWLAPKQLTFPLATLLANALSCFILGLTLNFFAKNYIDEKQKLLLITGICGGFSTFSTFTNETYQLFNAGQIWLSITNIILNMAICIIFLILGLKIF